MCRGRPCRCPSLRPPRSTRRDGGVMGVAKRQDVRGCKPHRGRAQQARSSGRAAIEDRHDARQRRACRNSSGRRRSPSRRKRGIRARGRQAQIVLEGHEVGAASECFQLDFEVILPAAAPLRRLKSPFTGAPGVVQATSLILQIAGHLDDEIAQRRSAACVEAAIHIHVGVDIAHDLLAKLALPVLGELGGSYQPKLLGSRTRR